MPEGAPVYPTTIPAKVHEALMDVRDSGVCNMADRNGVMVELNDRGESEALLWVNARPGVLGLWVLGMLEVKG